MRRVFNLAVVAGIVLVTHWSGVGHLSMTMTIGALYFGMSWYMLMDVRDDAKRHTDAEVSVLLCRVKKLEKELEEARRQARDRLFLLEQRARLHDR